MFLADLLIALVVGLLLAGLFILLFGYQGPWDIWWVFLLVIVLGAWAGGIWLAPFGPIWFEVSWLPFLLMGLFIIILLAAAVPPAYPRRVDVAGEVRAEEAGIAAFTIFFWILLVGLVATIVIGYLV